MAGITDRAFRTIAERFGATLTVSEMVASAALSVGNAEMRRKLARSGTAAHVVQLAGTDHVGFGSDFDGVGDSLPTGLKDVSQYPNLICELLRRGYSDEDIEKMCYKNVWRVWKEVEMVAAEM